MGGKRGGETWREFGTGKEMMGLENRKEQMGLKKTEKRANKRRDGRVRPYFSLSLLLFRKEEQMKIVGDHKGRGS